MGKIADKGNKDSGGASAYIDKKHHLDGLADDLRCPSDIEVDVSSDGSDVYTPLEQCDETSQNSASASGLERVPSNTITKFDNDAWQQLFKRIASNR